MDAPWDRLLDLMDEWRHLPAYRLEPRADLFFALYLPELVKSKLKCEVHAFVPEFPLCLEALYPSTRSKRSCKVDYLCRLSNADRVLFVELKTDSASRRSKQDDYLRAAQAAGFHQLLRALPHMRKASRQMHKYDALLRQLEAMGLVTRQAGEISVPAAAPDKIEVLYIQPQSGDPGCMSLCEVADVVERHPDPLSRRFAQSLRKWDSVRSGAANP